MSMNEGPDRVMLDSIISGDPSAAIEAQEARGQEQLVHSDMLPVDMGGKREEFEALGFEFGSQVPGDPLFIHAKLPEGWTKEAAPDHSMWSYINDTEGNRRVSVFYKAAFYDRAAHMGLVKQ